MFSSEAQSAAVPTNEVKAASPSSSDSKTQIRNVDRVATSASKSAHTTAPEEKYVVGEVYELESGKFSIWYGISFVGSFKSRAEAEAFWSKKNAAA